MNPVLEDFYKRFCKVSFNEKGVLEQFEPIIPENFNFAYDVVDEIAVIDPDKIALVWCNDAGEEKILTYRELSTLSNQAAHLFQKHGIKKGEMVLLVLKRHVQFWIAILALHKIGAVAIPATNLLTKSDFVYRMKTAGVKHIIATAEGGVLDTIDEALEEYHDVKIKYSVRGEKAGWDFFDELLPKESEVFERQPVGNKDTLLLYFTSGTTGYPKMVTHDHSYPIAHIITAKFWHNVSSESLHLTVSETGWAKSVWGKLYGQMLACGSVFVYDFSQFSAKNMLEKIKKYQVTSFCAPPTIYRFLLKEEVGNCFQSVTYATTAGEALNPDLFTDFRETTGLSLMEGFGQTEVTLLTANLVGMPARSGSLGKPTPLYDVRLIDGDEKPVSPGEVGEIVVKTSKGKRHLGIFDGYYHDKEQTSKVWHNGYYHTGDTAWQDEEGYFWYVGRTDDIIKASGYRIGPFEIENVLQEHDAVFECAVTGVPDEVRGAVVKATIVLSNGHVASDALVKELQDFVKKQTAPYKYPRIIEFVSELPKTISGKIKRADIRRLSEGK